MDFAPTSWFDVSARLLLAVFLGAMVGLERELGDKAAGLRTNMLVCLGAAFFMLVPIQAGALETDTTALGRILQGVITGVGFIGAGSIMRQERVRGLTSAAGIWVAAGLGIAAGLGEWELGLIGLLLTLLILGGVKRLERWM